MEKRFEIFVDDLETIDSQRRFKEAIARQLEFEPKTNIKRRKFLKKQLSDSEKIIQNRYTNFLRKIDVFFLSELLDILSDVKSIRVKAYRYEISPDNIVEAIKIKDVIDGTTLYHGYNRPGLKYRRVYDMLDIRSELFKSEVALHDLKGIDKIDMMYSLYNYEYITNDIFQKIEEYVRKEV